ncbi:MAG: DUF1616 domain-containing protein [Candidatus Woesearchaeota archaeon]|nr:DUF1616 domain-containing protein [Candidatus Woesearchaeota archaeon]
MIGFLLSVILVLFLPGYLLSLIIHKDIVPIERIILSIAYSIILDVVVGFFLGGNKELFLSTGGYQKLTVIILLISLCLLFFVILLARRRK